MKNTWLLIFLVNLSLGLIAQKEQKPQTLTSEQIQSTTLTIDQLVGLKSKFIIISCGIAYTLQKNGVEMTTMGAGLCLKSIHIQPCNDANPANFIKEWVNTAP